MPLKIHATVCNNEDDSYTIFVNKNLSAETQKRAALHELEHIKRGDLGSDQTADEIEVECRR